MTQLTFCGAAGTVTGSCSLIRTNEVELLVDCGMFQGNRSVAELNEKPFPFDAGKIEYLLLTHAHVDHSGLVPKLVKEGFSGAIYCTQPTADLLEFMLADSASIQESNAERRNRWRRRKGQPPIEPSYRVEHAKKAMSLMRPIELETWQELSKGVHLRAWNAGHMLGSASLELKLDQPGGDRHLRILFSGDLGPEQKAFHPEPDAPEGYDYIVCESTYGNRERDDYTLEGRRKALADELITGLKAGGNVVIPSFAVERSQELLHDIGVLLRSGELPPCKVFLDSPLAKKVTEVFIKHSAALQDIEVDEQELFRHPNFRLVQSVDESKAIQAEKSGAIIISASGMCDAGRIQHHLKDNIWRPESTVLFVGYQAPGTLGHVITRGSKSVRIHGRHFKVKARIRRIGNYSAHADQGELADWVMERAPVVSGLFLNHGEDKGRKALRDVLVERGMAAEKILLPRFDETFELVAGTAQSKGRAAVERIDEATLEADWHSDYAALILDLADALEAQDDGQGRRELLGRLRGVLEG
ncbi:MAG: MBL fold metallo-hydrolase [Acidobacteriota bacterium]